MVATAYQGFCPFRRHHRAVGWLGYLSAVGVYLGVYRLVAVVFPAGGYLPVAAAATAAAVPAGLYLGWLYGRAVGSPYGNVLLALATPPLVPWSVYAAAFPGASLSGGTWDHPLVVGPAAVAGLVAVLWAVRRSYARMDDPRAWERTVMPHGFRVVDDEWPDERPAAGAGRGSGGPRLDPRSEERVPLRLDFRGWLAGLVVVAPAVAAAYSGRLTHDDRAFSGIMLLAVLVLLHWVLRPEQDD